MHRYNLYLYTFLLLDIFFKASTANFNQGTYWMQKHKVYFPTIPNENIEMMSFTRCLIRCTARNTCKALFHTNNTGECYLRDSIAIRQSEWPMQKAASNVYYEPNHENILEAIDLTIPEFQTVFLGGSEGMTFKIFFDMDVTHQTALQNCLNFGGKLLGGLSLRRQSFFMSISKAMLNRGPYWIDVTNKYAVNFNDVNGYTTEDGQPLTIMFWALYEPEPGLNCVVMRADYENAWFSENCTSSFSYVCEL